MITIHPNLDFFITWRNVKIAPKNKEERREKGDADKNRSRDYIKGKKEEGRNSSTHVHRSSVYITFFVDYL